MALNEIRTLCNKKGFSCYTEDKTRFLSLKELLAVLKYNTSAKEPKGPKVHVNPAEPSKSDNCSQIDEWYNIFRKYPDIFPDVYFRFLKANLEESLTKGTYIWEDGVLLTWKQYKKSHDDAKVNDFNLEKLVSVSPGNGKAKEVMKKFLNLTKGQTCFLKVAKHNTRAICFYKKHGFKTFKAIAFGSTPALLMKRN